MMGRGWWLLCVLARGLEPAERKVVLGDLAESDEGVGAATCDLLGLIVRRQAGLWTVWRPWLALLGISGLAGVPLSRIAFSLNVDLGQQLMAYLKYGVHFETGVTPRQDMAFLLCLAVALLFWSWTCGFVLGSLSGRAVWLTWFVFYLIVQDSAWARLVLSGNIIVRDRRPLPLLMAAILPLSIATFLFSLSALCGMYLGVRRRALPLRPAYLLASAITILTILATWTSGWYETAHEIWSGGAWRGVSWPKRQLPFVLAGWPAAYLLATACRHTKERETI
ncbi:MAG: hypothetical protein DMG57_26865 [Acidobacteria bacterium]|nr:MAG: hypothetical protein DMG57_26865 [Acidobacteriota bacterium]